MTDDFTCQRTSTATQWVDANSGCKLLNLHIKVPHPLVYKISEGPHYLYSGNKLFCMMHQFQVDNNFSLLSANLDEHKGEDLKTTTGLFTDLQFSILLQIHFLLLHGWK